MHRYGEMRGQFHPLRLLFKLGDETKRNPVMVTSETISNIVEANITRVSGGSQEQKDFCMNSVFVLDTNKQPLNPVHPGRARTLLSTGKAAVFKRYPFTIILKTVVESPVLVPLRIKLDPGAKTTGIAVMDDASGNVVFAAELEHRGFSITHALKQRKGVRHSRRQRTTRYRFSCWQKHPRNVRGANPKGWLPPSLESRVRNVQTQVERLMRLCPIRAISMEHVKFDMQQMDNPEIAGVEYQQGTLVGYEVREYLLEKWHHQCAYCGKTTRDTDTGRVIYLMTKEPLQVEHIRPRAKGGTDRVSNLCLACEPCNKKKGTQDIKDFLVDQPERLKKIQAQAQAKAPLKDAAAVNATRWKLFERLKELGLPIECGSGGLTKFNRTQRKLPKEHWIDAACVGKSTPEQVHLAGVKPLLIKAMGSGCRQKCRTNKYGFPRTGPKGAKKLHGFQTGDIVHATILTGKHAGAHTDRMVMQADGVFYFGSGVDRVCFSYKKCTPVQRNDGYQYKVCRFS